MNHLFAAALLWVALTAQSPAQSIPQFTVDVRNGKLVLPTHGWGEPDHPDVYWFDLDETTQLSEGVEYLADIELTSPDGTKHQFGAAKVFRESVEPPPMGLTPSVRLILWLDDKIEPELVETVTISASERCVLPESGNFYYGISPLAACW
ncbi:hypothetical protein ASC89_17560 [Devosia sp. Root413D1]|uniref:hypothetical protein n=1 Tax=unclassified Devosia TaxID=196773 RepID=UPI0006FAF6B5|nr:MULTISPECIES: hypothetical protein [unclassified Devosia]KQU96667.1 hypothetical protein ASC68_15010 [Devosia sp. Root105]KQW77017.1 hypothetical protein ASC89_17560 [Devosia sp. Root413D1]